MSAPPITLITGASKGIGRSLAEHYLKLGHHVIGCSRGDTTLSSGDYEHHTLDVGDESAARKLFVYIRGKHGRLTNLVNNAGIASMNHALLTPGSSVEKLLRTNVLGTFLFSREAAKIMQRDKFGRMVNFTTVAVPLKLEGEAVYVASKAAVEALTAVLSREFSPFGITVNAVGPVPIITDLISGVPKNKLDEVVNRQAVPRYGRPEDVANAVDFFLRPESSLVTGQTLYLGGV